MFKSSLEQWVLLKSVVELGSMAKAAQLHHRSQPAISYQINQLQERLGVTLVVLQGRRLVLTDIGKELLEQANLLLSSWQDLELKASARAAGERSVVSLVVDSIFPRSLLFEGLRRFNQLFPQTQVHIKEIVRDEGLQQIERQMGDLYLVSVPESYPIEKRWIMDIRFVLVAKSDHPIFKLPPSLRSRQLVRYPLIQVVDKDNQLLNKYKKEYLESWYFTSVESAIDAVEHQLGYGWLPQRNIEPLLQSGQLQTIDDGYHPERVTSLFLVSSDAARHDSTVEALRTELFNMARQS
ncbi:LysR family transcriptional regulator [Celerinatantimonas sp. YJH-8]|uniref:LysR family transcriptional regulator n=1 Tax=Celerinatantimonas sp. YJH-8 TaxID=3228714 RepID=UPI0038BFD064